MFPGRFFFADNLISATQAVLRKAVVVRAVVVVERYRLGDEVYKEVNVIMGRVRGSAGAYVIVDLGRLFWFWGADNQYVEVTHGTDF